MRRRGIRQRGGEGSNNEKGGNDNERTMTQRQRVGPSTAIMMAMTTTMTAMMAAGHSEGDGGGVCSESDGSGVCSEGDGGGGIPQLQMGQRSGLCPVVLIISFCT